MGDKWTGGIVDQLDGPPTVETWRPVAVPGRPASFADATEPIAYRTTFSDPRTDDSERVCLELRGLTGQSEIWLNDERIGTHDWKFVPFRTTIDPQPENELVVVCDQPTAPGPTGAHATPGIHWGVDLESRPAVFLRRLEARPRLTDTGGVIDIELEVDAGMPIDDSITLSVRPKGFSGGATMSRLSVSADAGERVTRSDSFEIRDPALWWPRGYGAQHRYSVRAKLGDDSVVETVGFRAVDRDDDGLLVNGRRIRARGFTRLPGDEPVADVQRAVDANANLFRVREHVPPRGFYDACDEAGVLVWQELPATAGDPEHDRKLAMALEDTHGYRPSLALYGVPETKPTAAVDGLHGSGFLTKLRFRYRLWRTNGDSDSGSDSGSEYPALEALPDDRPVVSSVGPIGTDADASTLFPGWRYLTADDTGWLLERDPSLATIVAAFGVGSLTGDDADPDEITGLDTDALEAYSDTTAESSQAHQRQTVKIVAETLRRHESAALALETLRDPVPGGGMGVLTADGDSKPAYEAVAQSFEPVQAVLEGTPTTGSVGITLCNDTHEAHEATVAWQAGEDGGTTDVSVAPLEATDAGTAEIPSAASRIVLQVDLPDRTVRNEYDL